MHSSLQGIKTYFAAKFSANRLALAVGSKTQHPSFDFWGGMLEGVGIASSSCLVLVDQALLEGSRSLSWPIHFECIRRTHQLFQRCMSQRLLARLGCFSRQSALWPVSSVSALSYGCVDLRFRSSRCGMQCDAFFIELIEELSSVARRHSPHILPRHGA